MLEFNQNTSLFFYNLVPSTIQSTLDYDYLIQRNPSIKGIIIPNSDQPFYKCFYGDKEIIIPIFTNLTEANKQFPEVKILFNLASARSAYSVTAEAINTKFFHTIVIAAEGIPEQEAIQISDLAKKQSVLVLGPATVGFMVAGKLRVGNIGGSIENIIDSGLYSTGSIGLITRSGGLCNELCNVISKNSDGVSQAYAIGGDRFISTNFLDLCLKLENDAQTKAILLLGEVGGTLEYEVINAVLKKQITKPVIAYCIGTSANLLGSQIQFGHAGAQANSDLETATYKNQKMKEAGIKVPDNFSQIGVVLKQVSETLLLQKNISEIKHVPPIDLKDAVKNKSIRKPTNFICTISNDKNEDFTILDHKLVDLVKDDATTLVDILTLLWFKRKYPKWASSFIDKILKLLSDHGPAVSGAHNARVTARAGRDVISSLASGLLTIGPRFGGAIDDSAKYFLQATSQKQSPLDFVTEMKKNNINIPGIGHKVKSINNPDSRVKYLINYAKQNFPSTETLDFALQVEAVTTAKKANLILNVDGVIAALMIDLWKSLDYSQIEIQDMIETGVLNAFFAISRSIGFVGHILDEKRLKQPLYRHDTEDILYL